MLRVEQLTVDCLDRDRVAGFWAGVFGVPVVTDADGDLEVSAQAGLSLLFLPVPERKTGKNRLHLDLRPDPGEQDTEVARLLALGARRVTVGQGPDVSWVVLADPEDNEFCVLRGGA